MTEALIENVADATLDELAMATIHMVLRLNLYKKPPFAAGPEVDEDAGSRTFLPSSIISQCPRCAGGEHTLRCTLCSYVSICFRIVDAFTQKGEQSLENPDTRRTIIALVYGAYTKKKRPVKRKLEKEEEQDEVVVQEDPQEHAAQFIKHFKSAHLQQPDVGRVAR